MGDRMTHKNDGGAAYPTTPENEKRMDGTGGKGMSLRDYAAIHGTGLPDQCTSGYAAHFNPDPEPATGEVVAWAKWWAKAEWTARLINADAMLSAREETK